MKSAEGGIPGLLAEIPGRSRAVFDAPILASHWYPYEAYLDLLETVDRRRGLPDFRAVEDLGRSLAPRDIGFLFKFVVAVASIETMARRCPLFWKQHCDTGTLECTHIDTRARRATAVIRGVPGLRPVHCHLVGGWIEGMSAGAGAKGMRVRQVACFAEGAPECRFEGEWTG